MLTIPDENLAIFYSTLYRLQLIEKSYFRCCYILSTTGFFVFKPGCPSY